MQIHFYWETWDSQDFLSSIYLGRPAKSKWMLLDGYGSPFLFLTSVTKRGIHLFRFCVSGLSNRSSAQRSLFPSCSFLVNIHSRKRFKAQRVFFCVFCGTCPFITAFMSLSFRGLPKRFLVATVCSFLTFWTRYLKIRVFVIHRACYHTNPNGTGVSQRLIQAKTLQG